MPLAGAGLSSFAPQGDGQIMIGPRRWAGSMKHTLGTVQWMWHIQHPKAALEHLAPKWQRYKRIYTDVWKSMWNSIWVPGIGSDERYTA